MLNQSNENHIKTKKVVILIGAPGAGKGVQAKKIESKYSIPQISTGDLIRKAIENKTKYGTIAKTFIEKGALVSDDIILELLFERLEQIDCINGFILDGFPRNKNQSKILLSKLNNQKIKAVVIQISIDEQTAIERIIYRQSCKCGASFGKKTPPKIDGICDLCGSQLSKRSDDVEETIKQRLVFYKADTAPIIQYLKESLSTKEINGSQEIEPVSQEIFTYLDQEFNKSQQTEQKAILK